MYEYGGTFRPYFIDNDFCCRIVASLEDAMSSENVDICDGTIKEIQDAVQRYFEQTAIQDRGKTRPGASKKRIKKFHKDVTNLSKSLEALHDFDLGKISSADIPRCLNLYDDLKKILKDSAYAAEKVIGNLPADKGGLKPEKSILRELICSLGTIYQKATGRSPGISTDPIKDEYIGPFFRFVLLVYQKIISETGQHLEPSDVNAFGFQVKQALRENQQS